MSKQQHIGRWRVRSEAEQLADLRKSFAESQRFLIVVGPLYPHRVKGRSRRGWTTVLKGR